MTPYEKLLNNFYCCLEAVEKVAKKEEPVPATTRLVAAELQDVLYLVEDLYKLSTVGEIEAQNVREFADTLCDEIRARIKSLMNPMGLN